MIDPDATAVSLALADSALVTLTNGQIYAGDAPPQDHNPATAAVCLKSRGGRPTYEDLANVSIQAKCYGATAVDAWATYVALYDALHLQSSATVTSCISETTGQALTEPSTGKRFVLAYFQMFVRP